MLRCHVLQVNLTWLDLSFNQIETVEGLEKLTRLQDLSLHHNKLTSIDALVHSPALATLSVGVQALSRLSMPWHQCTTAAAHHHQVLAMLPNKGRLAKSQGMAPEQKGIVSSGPADSNDMTAGHGCRDQQPPACSLACPVL